MASLAPDNPNKRPDSAGRGSVGATATLDWDALRSPHGVVTLLSALTAAGLATQKKHRRSSRPTPRSLSCAPADDWVTGPTPEPAPTPVFAQLELTEDCLQEAYEEHRAADRAYARRARKLDEARQHGQRAVMLSEAGTDPGPNFTGWTQSEIAYRGFIPQVACALHISERAAETLVTSAERLVHDVPDTLALLDAGDTSYRHAESLVRHSHGLSTEQLAEYETILIPFAKKLTPAAFDNKARRVADNYKDDPLTERHEEALERRSVTLNPCHDGMAEVVLYVDAVDASAIFNRLTTIGRGIQHPTDGRNLTQIRTDVATTLLLQGVTDDPGTGTEGTVHGFDPTAVGKGKRKGGRKGLGVGINATVSIHVPVLSLLDHGDEPATLEGYGPISMDRARELMARGATSFTRILTHPETGAILSVGQEKYVATAAMRLFLMTRDLTCRFPGCTTAARFCDLDHTDDWQYGGATDAVNLAHLCKRHHALKHNTDWSYTQDEFGVMTWVSPTGATHVTEPETWLQGKPPAAEADAEQEIPEPDLHHGHPNTAQMTVQEMRWPTTPGGDAGDGRKEYQAGPSDPPPPEGFPF